MLKVQLILPRFGAELSGVDISKPLSDADSKAILDAMAQWGVCVFRNTGLDDESHIAFSRIFGHIELAPLRGGARTRLRHRELLAEALERVQHALALQDDLELAAEDVRLASRALDRITGRIDPEEVLGRVFSSFCIGK